MRGDPFIRLKQTATFAGDGHRRWCGALVAVIGVGNLGSRFATEVVRSGARVWICDPDTGAVENLGTQQVDIGKPKAESVAGACNAIFRGGDRAEYLVEDIRFAGVEALQRCDLIVDTTDDPGLAEYLTRVSNGVGRPLLRLALDGQGSHEFGRVLASDGGNGFSCQLCTHQRSTEIHRRTPCDERSDVPPTRAGGAIGMTVAGVGLLQAQRIVTGCDAGLVRDREVLVDLTNLQLHPQILERSPDCISGHESWDVVTLSKAANEVTLDLIFDLARDQVGDVDVEVDLELHRAAMRFHKLEGQDLGLIEQPVTRIGVTKRECVILNKETKNKKRK